MSTPNATIMQTTPIGAKIPAVEEAKKPQKKQISDKEIERGSGGGDSTEKRGDAIGVGDGEETKEKRTEYKNNKTWRHETWDYIVSGICNTQTRSGSRQFLRASGPQSALFRRFDWRSRKCAGW
jgi:hypothetical protein